MKINLKYSFSLIITVISYICLLLLYLLYKPEPDGLLGNGGNNEGYPTGVATIAASLESGGSIKI